MITQVRDIYESTLFCVRCDEDIAEELRVIGGECDIFVVNRLSDFDGRGSPLIEAIASYTVGWVEVFGPHSECIHDQIDLSSVRAGRQNAAGNGIPMTSWYDETCDVDVARYILSGGQGCAKTKLVVIVGELSDESAFLELLSGVA